MTFTPSEYINDERRNYSLYVLQQRAIPHAADGLKAAARRVLWTGRDGTVYKSASLAGATMPIHPHASPESTVNTLAGFYSNNIPLLAGEGGFGTILKPGSFAASRYTSVSVSAFTKDVVFRDIEIIPHQENYDGKLTEPVHFLPLVPIALLNPQEGIAVGFACSILPRSLDSIIASQIEYLNTGEVTDVYPAMVSTDNWCEEWYEDKSGGIRWVFKGSFEKVNATTINITNLPYGMIHSKYITKLDKLIESGDVQEVIDGSVDQYNIQVRFKKGVLRGKTDDEILNILSLTNSVTENLNLIDFDGKRVLNTSYTEFVASFTQWRLNWYLQRYERLAGLLEIDIQRYLDVLNAIKNDVGGKAAKFKSRQDMKDFLATIGVVYIDYIADLSVYRFTEEERRKIETKLAEARKLMKNYQSLIKSEPKRKEVYLSELQEVLAKHKKGAYNQ